ncbi:Nucleic acid-binding proteins superfamily [Perilla frutescens var. hirtella]|uniref:Nucleic acid-binding proteins superfamily n=1 Tax=Perilla frutescens var. hirtella TaxID=608512 RepID=A0AAD4IUR4_PERFH|nr:Nucleic acid-binding proteins superfamily [Perilla frutescens var. hirtella]
MPVLVAASLSGGFAFLSHFPSSSDNASQNPLPLTSLNFSNSWTKRPIFLSPAKVSVSSGSSTRTDDGLDQSSFTDDDRQSRRSADWKAAKAYHSKGLTYEGRVEGFNGGGLLIKFYSLLGFLPYPQLSPSHACREPQKSIQEIARALVGSIISVKVIQADEESRKLIFSEKEANWYKFSSQLKVGNIFEARVGSVEDYGAFVHLRFPDGLYHLTGLVHVSEVSWDLVQDVRDVLSEGDEVRVKIVNIDREKSRITLSIKQLEEDPLLETLDKVIPQDISVDPDALNTSDHFSIEPLPGLYTIVEELLKEDGIISVKISRQGFEKRVVSQDLQLWLSNAPPTGDKYTLLARAGRQVQEIQLTTSLDQDGIKRALQRVLERVP